VDPVDISIPEGVVVVATVNERLLSAITMPRDGAQGCLAHLHGAAPHHLWQVSLTSPLTSGKLVGQDQAPRSFRDLIGHRLVLDYDLVRRSHALKIPDIERLLASWLRCVRCVKLQVWQ
jgi:hypothetical protein